MNRHVDLRCPTLIHARAQSIADDLFHRPTGRGSKPDYTRSRVSAARPDDATLMFSDGCSMDRSVGAAARLPESDREELAIQALARSETVSDLAARHGLSRKFVHQQAHKARVALDDVFSPETPEDGVFLKFTVTKAWLRQVIGT